MFAVIIFIIVLSVLIFVHELGHFLIAKRAGLKVEEFGFGFPPKIMGIKHGETIYSINWIPFGGFVKILGEDGEERDNSRSLASAKPLVRSGILVAGVVMNFLLAVILLSFGNAVGLRVGLPDDSAIANAHDIKIQIVSVVSNSPADSAGLKPLDEIAGFAQNGQDIQMTSVTAVQDYINSHKGQGITIEIKNGSQVTYKQVTPRANPPAGEGALGIALAATGLIKYPLPQAIIQGITDSANIASYTAVGYATIIKNIFTTGKPGVELSGPVGIAVITGKAAQLGFTYLMQFMALISINLAVLNIIPFPALDGGRLLFVIIEKIKGSPISKKIENGVNAAGFALLILLMIYVTTKDIIKFF
jgi:regulator of sigma E protease